MFFTEKSFKCIVLNFCLLFVISNPLVSSEVRNSDVAKELSHSENSFAVSSHSAFKATYADFLEIIKPAWRQLFSLAAFTVFWEFGQVKLGTYFNEKFTSHCKQYIEKKDILSIFSIFCFQLVDMLLADMIKLPIQKHILDKSKIHLYSSLFGRVLQQSHAFFQDHSPAEITLNIEETVEEVVNVLPVIASKVAEILVLPIAARDIYLENQKKLDRRYFCIQGTYLGSLFLSTLIICFLPQFFQVDDTKDAIDLLPKKPIDIIASTLSNIDTVRLYNGFEKEKSLLKVAGSNNLAQNSLRCKLKISSGYIPSILALTIIIAIPFIIGELNNSHFLRKFFFRQSTSSVKTFQAIMFLKKTLSKLSLLLAPPTVVDKPDAKDLVVKEGRIDFENVVFRYRKKDGDMFTLSIPGRLTINPGERVAFVGKTGCGKTSLVSLLCRLYDPEQGAIYIDGQDIRSVRQSDLHKNIALVSQRPQVFPRTVKDNIAYPNSEESLDNVVAASQAAEADEFISNMAEGYDSPLVGGALGLSGGQAQRLGIARCLLKDAQIFVLDEATSALDSKTENDVRDNMQERMFGKTCIIIAHRYSTLRGVDRIFVFDEGQIVEVGTHAELLAKNGHYAELWNAQMDGLREVADC